MQQRFAFVLVVLCSLLIVSTAFAQMDATMKRGDTQTFTVPFSYTAQTFMVNEPLEVVITASPELILGHTTVPGFNCTETPNATTCRGNVPGTAGSQSITITQALSVLDEASRSSASWTIQLVGEGFSGVAPKSGVISIPDPKARVRLTGYTSYVSATPNKGGSVGSLAFDNSGDAPGTIRLIVDPASPFSIEGTKDFTTVIPVGFGLTNVSASFDPRPLGTYKANVQLIGVENRTQVELVVVVFDPPIATPKPAPSTNRVDIASSANGPNPTVAVAFTNSGPGAANGALSTDAPWVTPADPAFSLLAGETKVANFIVDVVKQQQVLKTTGGTGSLIATLTFNFLLPASGKTSTATVLPQGNPPGTGSVSVTLVSTVSPTASNAAVPPLTGFHEQLFLAGVGHVQGSVGLFISDLVIFPQTKSPSFRSLALTDLDLYYTPLGGGTSRKATIASLATPNIAALGDLVGSVYGATAQVGSLQIRAPGYLAGEGYVGVNANVFNVSGKAGTYGTTIPVFKYGAFQCGSQELAKKLYLTGLLKNASGHTNFYVQETCNSATKVTLDFYDGSGTKIGSSTTDVPPFAAVQLGSSVIPTGAVSAVLSHAAGSAGGFVAYATPVDEASGDTWAQVDWPNQRGYQGSAPVIIPVAGATPGANNTYFRTDLSIMNTGSTAGTGTLRFYNRTGEIIDKTLSLGSLQTATYVDVTTTLFGITTPHVGYLIFTPTSGTFVLTSRNYSTPVGSNATFGTAVPTLALSAALTQSLPLRRIGGVEDASPDAVAAARGATFRSNLGLIETSGQAATVKVTVYFNTTSSLTSTVNGASTTINLTPNQFLLQGLGSTIFGANRSSFGDLHNVTVEFEVIGGTGKVIPFISSVDNGTGDSTFRTE